MAPRCTFRWLGVAALCWLLSVTVRPVTAQAATDITLDIVPGFAGYVRYGGWLPIEVDVQNGGPDVTGEFVATAIPIGSSQTKAVWPQQSYDTRYSAAVTLPHTARKRIMMDLPLTTLAQHVRVDLIAHQTVIATAEAPVTVLGAQQLLVGVVGDAPGAIASLRATTVPRISTTNVEPIHVAAVSAASLPAHADELACFDALVFDNVSTQTLSASQVSALDAWVSGGGALILVGGPRWASTIAGLPAPLLPVQRARLGDTSNLAGLGTFVGGAPPQAGTTAMTVATADRADIVAMGSAGPLIVVKPHGGGSVAFLAADIASPPLAGWSGAADLWRRLFVLTLHPQPLVPTQFGAMPMQPDISIVSALGNMPALDPPSLGLLVGLLALYVALAAPVNYLVLRGLGKRSWSWITLPILALGFTALTYGIAFRAKGSAAIVNEISVRREPPGAGMVEETTYTGLFAPSERTYHVEPATHGLVAALPAPNYFRPIYAGTGAIHSIPLGMVVREGTPTQVELVKVAQWTIRGFRTDRWVAAPPSIEAHLIVDASGVTGRIINRTSTQLLDCVLLGPWGSQRLGTLEPGAAVPIRLSVTTPWLSVYPSQLFAQEVGQPGMSPRAVRLAELKGEVVSGVWPSYGAQPLGDGRLGALVLLGWTGPAAPAPAVDGQPVAVSGFGLVAAGLPLDLGQAHVVPSGLLPLHVASVSGTVQPGFGGIALGQGAITYAARLPNPAAPLTSATVELTLPGLPGNIGIAVSFYNWQTRRYDPIPTAIQPVVFQMPRPLGAAVPPPLAVTAAPTRVPSATVASTATRNTPTRTSTATRTTLTPTPTPTVKPAPSTVMNNPRIAQGKYMMTRVTATLQPVAARTYVGSDGTIRFRIAHRSRSVITVTKVAIGYAVGGGRQ